MREPKVIVFDLGNVVLSNDWHYDCPKKFEAFEERFEIDYDDMEDGWNAAWEPFFVGDISEDEFWRRFISAAGASDIDVSFAKETYRKYQCENEDMLSVVATYSEDRPVYGLSDISKEWLAFKRERFGLSEIFESIVASGHVGSMKPDDAMYEELLGRVEYDAESVLFVDDSEKNLVGAEKHGIMTYLFESSDQFRRDLRLV